MTRWIRYLAARAQIELAHAWTCAGYWLRPYDMAADARRWRWQPRARCGSEVWASTPPEAQAAVLAALDEAERRRK